MTERELKELERLAKAATPGRWIKDVPAYAMPWMVGVIRPHSEEPVREVICTLDVRYGNTDEAPRALDIDYGQVMADAAFIAAACPRTILKLISELRSLRAAKYNGRSR